MRTEMVGYLAGLPRHSSIICRTSVSLSTSAAAPSAPETQLFASME